MWPVAKSCANGTSPPNGMWSSSSDVIEELRAIASHMSAKCGILLENSFPNAMEVSEVLPTRAVHRHPTDSRVPNTKPGSERQFSVRRVVSAVDAPIAAHRAAAPMRPSQLYDSSSVGAVENWKLARFCCPSCNLSKGFREMCVRRVCALHSITLTHAGFTCCPAVGIVRGD
jgi:hypothetical protein